MINYPFKKLNIYLFFIYLLFTIYYLFIYLFTIYYLFIYLFTIYYLFILLEYVNLYFNY